MATMTWPDWDWFPPYTPPPRKSCRGPGGESTLPGHHTTLPATPPAYAQAGVTS